MKWFSCWEEEHEEEEENITITNSIYIFIAIALDEIGILVEKKNMKKKNKILQELIFTFLLQSP